MFCDFCECCCFCHTYAPCAFCTSHVECEVCGKLVCEDQAITMIDKSDSSDVTMCPYCEDEDYIKYTKEGVARYESSEDTNV